MTTPKADSAGLTKAMRAALESVARRDGYMTPWVIGTRTAEALRARGLIQTSTGEPIKFGGRWGYDPCLTITPAGRIALGDGQ